MRLLYVIHQFFPDCHSGTEQYCLWNAQEAARHGHEVTVLSLHWDHDRDWPPIRLFEQPYDGLRVLRLNHWRRINPNDVLRDYENRHLEGWFRAVLDDVRPDAVHFFHLRQLGSNLIPIAKGFGARVAVSLMDFWFLCPRFTLQRSDGSLCSGPPDGGRGCVACAHPELAGEVAASGDPETTDAGPARLAALLRRPRVQQQNLLLADSVFAPSDFLAERFAQNGFPRDRLEVVRYGLAPDRIRPLAAVRPRDPLRIGFCGVLSPWKAPHLLVEAVRDSSLAVHVTIHGRLEEPMFQGYVDTLRREAGTDPRFVFAGAYAHVDAPRVFADMDVLVVPSTWYENTPFVVLEAFAAGVPVLASDLGGLSEVVREGVDGLLFRPGSASSLREVLARLVADPALVTRLAPRGAADVAQGFARFARAYSGEPS